MKRPALIPPCPGWKEDFNLPNDLPKVKPNPGLVNANHQEDSYLETSRHSLNMRGLLFICIPTSFPALILLPDMLLESLTDRNYTFFLIGLIILLIAIWQTTLFLRLLRLTPRDEPIRFNRARQRIYAYNFSYCWWNPFIPWPVKTVSYEWKDVRAERWKKQGVTHQGSHVVKVGIMLSIVEPGTNKVIDRFPLTNLVDEESVWAYICTYMQHGLSAVPPAPLNRDHNDLLWCQFAMRLAPEVKWPEKIDHESRTTPQAIPPVKVALP
ncbi:DUF6708 domain-containing protein [Pseudomonas peradeniyensis]|uniref:DUF6708 domain-containing protein n=1 Tax=Pseudomonas peradeniyensis TaxID=2745488 RepID=UPI001CEDB83D|nr:DUF6708 domain-containing protein [Pseudomonas peradeniyensis]